MPEADEIARFNARQQRYRLVDEVGAGGMARVYRGHDRVLDRAVAVKLFKAAASDNEQLRAQQQEARLLASFAHHSLVRLFDAGVDFPVGGAPRVFLVMELVEGLNLRERLRAAPLSLLHVAYIGFDLAEGIAFLHAGGVMHRDVKPANVLLLQETAGRRPRVKLADFGIARVVGTAPSDPDEDATGTAAYLSPEQAAGEPVGVAADVYALGLVMIEAITRRTEFPGGVYESAFARLDRDPQVPSGLPPAWASLLKAMTSRRPAERPTAAQVAESFRAILVEEVREAEGAEAPVGTDRLEAVRRYDLLAPQEDPELQQLCELAVRLTGAGGAVIAIADEDRALVRARAGAPFGAGLDDRYVEGVLEEHPVVHRGDAPGSSGAEVLPLLPEGGAFYASAPVLTHDGVAIGVIAVLDRHPRAWSAADAATLADVAETAMHEIELRRAVRRLLLSNRAATGRA